MGLIKEFKEFVMKGSVVDLAVAVVIGAAFGAIITSLVDDVITPLLLNPALKAANVELDRKVLSELAVNEPKAFTAVVKTVIK